MSNLKKQILCVAALAGMSGAFAAPVTYFKENLVPGGAVTADVLTERNRFTSALAGNVQSYGFQNASAGDVAPLVVPFASSTATSISATLAGDGIVRNTPEAGRFSTTGGGDLNYWRAKAGTGAGNNTAGLFSITFSTAISAFGFYGTDIGDFEGTLSLLLTPSGGGADVQLDVPNSIGSNGSLLFFGFLDRTISYSKITFRTAGSSVTSDYFGFDDFLVADRNQITATATPEPGSLALAGLGLLAAASITLRRRRAAR